MPALYVNTRMIHNGARHLVGSVFLGAGVTVDPDGLENALAAGSGVLLLRRRWW